MAEARVIKLCTRGEHVALDASEGFQLASGWSECRAQRLGVD